MFALVALAPFLLGMLAFGILSANYYHTQAHSTGFWSNIKWYFGTQVNPIAKAKEVFGQIISNYMGQAVQRVDAHVAASFHYIATEVRAASDMMLQFSAFALTIAQAVSGKVAWAEVGSALKQLRAEIRVAEHKAQVATERAIAQEKAAVRSVAQGVYPRLRGLEHDVTDVIPREIASARELAKDAADAAIHSARWLRTHEKSVAATTFAGAVAWALSRLGLGWLRCHSNPFNRNKDACGLLGILGNILGFFAGIALAIFSVLKPQDLAEAAVAAVDVIEPLLADILSN